MINNNLNISGILKENSRDGEGVQRDTEGHMREE